jgi:hypothetical protein
LIFPPSRTPDPPRYLARSTAFTILLDTTYAFVVILCVVFSRHPRETHKSRATSLFRSSMRAWWVRASSPDINSAQRSHYFSAPHPSRMFLRERAEISSSLPSVQTDYPTRIVILSERSEPKDLSFQRSIDSIGRTSIPVCFLDLSPLFATLTKTAGVYPYSSQFGTVRLIAERNSK